MKFLKFFFLISLSISLLTSCGDDDDGNDNPPASNITVWTGPTVSFTKAEGSDPTVESNQDRINDDVWITRNNQGQGGQIYNAVTETVADKDTSPAGTLWALGSTSNIDNLSFDNFRATVGNPKQVVGKDLVLLLVGENVALDIKFTSWSQDQGGGFAYDRASE